MSTQKFILLWVLVWVPATSFAFLSLAPLVNEHGNMMFSAGFALLYECALFGPALYRVFSNAEG